MANRYENIQIISGSAPTDIRYYRNVIYPEIEPTEEDTYIIASSFDRLDLVANDFYGDPNLWWIISSANNLPGNSLYITNGTQLRVPANPLAAFNKFVQLNQLR